MFGSNSNLDGADTERREALGGIPEREQCQVIILISRLCCAVDGTLSKKGSCSLCDVENPAGPTKRILKPQHNRDIFAIFSMLINAPFFVASKRLRVVAMVALRKLVLHTDDVDFFDIESSAPAQWCIQSLQSSVRELRIAAG